MGESTRAEQREASEAAILDAAFRLYATHGPKGISLRAVSQEADLTHALVIRWFGSKQGLVSAVEQRLEQVLTSLTDGVDLCSHQGLFEVMSAVHHRPTTGRLLVRSGLGDLGEPVVGPLIGERWPSLRAIDRRHRLCGYGAACLVLGWFAWRDFLTAALQMGPIGRERQDDAMAAAASAVLRLAAGSSPTFRPRRLCPVDAVEAIAAAPDRSAREALLASAVHLFAEHGPAAVSIRDIARHAGLNHGLVHRHFGSRDALLAEAIEIGSSSLVPGALAPGGFDIDIVVDTLHHESPSPKTIARMWVDGIPVRSVRRRFPIMSELLRLTDRLPTQARPAELADPRLAAAAAVSLVVGSSIWAAELRPVYGLVDDQGVESAVADLGRHLLGAPLVGSERLSS